MMSPRRSGLLLLAMSAFITLPACSFATRTKVPVEEMRERRTAFVEEIEKEKLEMFRVVSARLERIVEAAQTTGERPTYNILLLSGGGDYGAFGAGFLYGWGQIADEDMRRPQFDFVTGVSTGALIAPYAFIGSDESIQHVMNMYENPQKDWLKSRTLLNILTHQRSIYNVDGLHKYVRANMTQEMASQIRDLVMEDRVLMAGATSLDYGVFRPFNLGAEFAVAAENGDRSHAVDIMLASSAIPGGFPPITINDDLFVDGGATVQMWMPHERTELTDEVHWIRERFGDIHPRIRVWAIVNNKMAEPPKIVQPRLGAIIGRSLGISIRSSVLLTLRDIETLTLLLNARQSDVEFHYVAIPEDFEDNPEGGFFDKDTMSRLGELGRRMGRDPRSWQTHIPSVEWPDEIFLQQEEVERQEKIEEASGT